MTDFTGTDKSVPMFTCIEESGEVLLRPCVTQQSSLHNTV